MACPSEPSGKEAKPALIICGLESEKVTDEPKDGEASSPENICPEDTDGKKESKNDLESGKHRVSSGDAPANDVPGIVYCVYVLNAGTVLNPELVVGPPTEKETKPTGGAADNLVCLSAVTSGGVKALDKTGATENPSIKVDKASAGGGTIPIPTVV